MKNFTCNLFLILSLFFFSGLVTAQSIPDGVIPEVGDVAHSITGEPENITEGASGNGVTWDFSEMVPSPLSETITLTYIHPDETPHAAAFPDADLAIEFPSDFGSTFSYYDKNNNRLEYIGGEALGTFIYYDEDPQLVIDATMSGSDSVMDEYKGFTDNSQTQIYTKGTQEFQIDASGTLMLPSGTFPNAVRIVNNAVRVDSSGSEFFMSIITTETTTYSWVIPGQTDPVMSVIYTEGQSETIISGSPPMITEIPLTKSVFYNPNAEGGTTATRNLGQLTGVQIENVAPNPTFGNINIQMKVDQTQLVNFRLSNIIGRTLRNESAMLGSGLKQHQMDLSALPNGTYILSISNENEITSRKVIKRD